MSYDLLIVSDVHLTDGRAPAAGEVVALGPGAGRYGWKVGDRVAGTSHDACGVCQKCVEGRYNLCENYGKPGLHKQYGHNAQGADATYVVHGIKSIFPLPDGLTFDEGAVVDPASIALHVANRGAISPGDSGNGTASPGRSWTWRKSNKSPFTTRRHRRSGSGWRP